MNINMDYIFSTKNETSGVSITMSFDDFLYLDELVEFYQDHNANAPKKAKDFCTRMNQATNDLIEKMEGRM